MKTSECFDIFVLNMMCFILVFHDQHLVSTKTKNLDPRI